MLVIEVVRDISILVVGLGILYLLYPMISRSQMKNIPKRGKKKDGKFAILIPARDESRVIRGLLDSLKEQTEPVLFSDVYVIVETEKDPTVKICKEYHANVIYRRNLKQQRKGYALNDAIVELLKKQKKYDAYFIFDADNILDRNYFKEMKKTYLAGYDIGIGYRNCKNGNRNIFAACSSLTFSMINTIGNEGKKKHGETMIVSGTGFYIVGEWIQKWKGYPFHSLTEDYELSLYATLYGMTTDYNKKAIFYDEQPTQYHTTVQQRIRWIRGYFDARKKYIPLIRRDLRKNKENENAKRSACVGVKPYIMIIVGMVLWALADVIAGISRANIAVMFLQVGMLLLAAYIAMMIVTIVMLRREKEQLHLSVKMKRHMIWFYPLYLVTYIPCALKAMLKKNVTWVKIDHTETNL